MTGMLSKNRICVEFGLHEKWDVSPIRKVALTKVGGGYRFLTIRKLQEGG